MYMSTKTQQVASLPNELVVEGRRPSDKKSQKHARKTLKRNKGGNPLLFLRDAQTKITELNGHLQKNAPICICNWILSKICPVRLLAIAML